MKAKETINNGNYPLWRQESIKIISPATFVWKDEFEDVWNSIYSKECMTLPNERPGYRCLNYDPLILSNFSILIYEGFNSISSIPFHHAQQLNKQESKPLVGDNQKTPTKLQLASMAENTIKNRMILDGDFWHICFDGETKIIKKFIGYTLYSLFDFK